MSTNQVKSKKRVRDHGEVFTPDFIVNDMLDLVKNETERIESRFLEPACGDGNFLAPVLKRKMSIVEKRYLKSKIEYERNALMALASIYGIELLQDNIETGKGNPTLATIERIAQALNVSIEQLIK